MSADIRALSVWNPWAWALCAGLKTHENRDWKLPRAFIGQRVLIHCGKSKPDPLALEDVEDEAQEAGIVMPDWARRPVGGIIGSLIFDLDETPEQGDTVWCLGERCWRVKPRSAVLYSAVIPCRGALGFFRPPASLVERVTP